MTRKHLLDKYEIICAAVFSEDNFRIRLRLFEFSNEKERIHTFIFKIDSQFFIYCMFILPILSSSKNKKQILKTLKH